VRVSVRVRVRVRARMRKKKKKMNKGLQVKTINMTNHYYLLYLAQVNTYQCFGSRAQVILGPRPSSLARGGP
jgi:hypothetical protein